MIVAIDWRPLLLSASAAVHPGHRLVLLLGDRLLPTWRACLLPPWRVPLPRVVFHLVHGLPLVAVRLARPSEVELHVVDKVCRVSETVVADVAARTLCQDVAHPLRKS